MLLIKVNNRAFLLVLSTRGRGDLQPLTIVGFCYQNLNACKHLRFVPFDNGAGLDEFRGAIINPLAGSSSEA
jgi:hypothetical protein